MAKKRTKKFVKLETKLAKRGAKKPRALAAWIGRKKYGAKKFEAMAEAGRRKKS